MPVINTEIARPTIIANGTTLAQFDPVYSNDIKAYNHGDVVNIKGSVNLTFGVQTGGTVRYTLNGDNPTETSPAFSTTVTLTENKTGQYTVVKARTYLEGLSSGVAKSIFNIHS